MIRLFLWFGVNMVFKIVVVIGCFSGIGFFMVVLLVSDKDRCFKVYVIFCNFVKKGELEEKGRDFFGDMLIIKEMDVCFDDLVNEVI